MIFYDETWWFSWDFTMKIGDCFFGFYHRQWWSSGDFTGIYEVMVVNGDLSNKKIELYPP